MRGKVVSGMPRDDNIGITPAYAGKGFAAGVLMPACGITPAYAGKSDVTVLQNGIAEDHPRLCGEKLLQYHRIR